MSPDEELLTAKRLRELMDYDPLSGEFIWKVNRGRGARIGTVAGTFTNSGYRQIKIYGVHYPAARLAYLWMTGRWPENLIDHKDMDRGNNKWSNLREATHSQNHANEPRRYSSSGYKGVTLVKRSGLFQAQIRVNYRNVYLGQFNTAEEAHAVYVEAAKKHFGEFARG